MTSLDSTITISSWVNTKAEEFAVTKPLKPKRKPRRRTSKEQLAALEEFFLTNRRPNTAAKEQLAQELEMNPRTIQIWFQNRRQSLKKKKLEPLIVPRDPQSEDEKKDKRRKREYTVLKLNYKSPKPSQISWHYESASFPKSSPDLPLDSPPVTPPESGPTLDIVGGISRPRSSSPNEVFTLPSLQTFEAHRFPRIETLRLSPCYQPITSPPPIGHPFGLSLPSPHAEISPGGLTEESHVYKLPPLRTLSSLKETNTLPSPPILSKDPKQYFPPRGSHF